MGANRTELTGRPIPISQPISNNDRDRTLERAIADELRTIIQRRGLTQVAAAALLGTSTKHLNRVLHLRSHPSLATLERWSERLGITWEVHSIDAEK